jgi:TRAP-type mannitol/chloroaromatic compound transport system permease small subunit
MAFFFMQKTLLFVDKVSTWVGHAFSWLIVGLTLLVTWEVFSRYALGDPHAWAFDAMAMLYGTMFMMAGAYTLSRDGHVRGDFIYRLWKPRVQAAVELVLYFIFFFPGVTALVLAGWKYAARSFRYLEVSSNSPAGIPIFQFKAVIVAAGILLFVQGIAQMFRCVVCLRTGTWPRAAEDVEETEKVLMEAKTLDVLHHGSEAVDLPFLHPDNQPDRDGEDR